MGIRLWLDDKRPCPEGWVHAHTAEEAIRILGATQVDEASLDHDLGHCDNCTTCNGYKSACGCKCHWTGYSVTLYMASTGRWPAKKPTVHSANPAGAANMRAVIDRYFGARLVYPKGEFRLSWKEQEAAERFEKRHRRRCTKPISAYPGHGHAGFTYKFTQTGIGCAVAVVCLSCRKKRNVTDYDSW